MYFQKDFFFIDLLSCFIEALEKVEAILLQVQQTGKTSDTKSIIYVFDELFKSNEHDKHFEYKITLIGQSSQAIYWGERTEENSNKHITLNLKSDYIIYYNHLYDGKIDDLLKFFKHVFSLIENFSIGENTHKVSKFYKLVDIIKRDYIYWKAIQIKAIELGDKQNNFIKAFNFLSYSVEKKTNWQNYLQILISNDIKYLYHFTDKSNINSIKEHQSLFSWHYCKVNDICISRPGGNEISRKFDQNKGLENFVRLSFCENHPMKFVALKDGRIKDPITLKCDTEIILHKNTLYSNCNANKAEAIINDRLELFENLKFDIFNKNYLDLNADLKSYYQAEILVFERLPAKYIFNLDEL